MSNENYGRDQANAQMDSIKDMVSALGVDFDRLEELQALRDELKAEFDTIPDNDGIDFDDWARNQHLMTSEDCDELDDLIESANSYTSLEAVEQAIGEDALSVEFRSGWSYDPNEFEAEEFRISLCTGGPSVQIRGELSNGEPSRAWLEYQGWGEPMTERVNQPGDMAALLAYAKRYICY